MDFRKRRPAPEGPGLAGARARPGLAGRGVVDPWWDLHSLAGCNDDWPRFIARQVRGRIPVNSGGMTARVEEVLDAALRRL